MNKPLRFKSYNPDVQQSQKPKKKAPVPNVHSGGLMPQVYPKQCQPVAEALSGNHDVNDVLFMDPTLVDWSSDSCAVLRLGDSYSAYNEDNQMVHEHPNPSTSHALQPTPVACWQSAEVQSFVRVEECITVDSPRPSTNNSNGVTRSLSPLSPGGIATRARTENPSPENLRDENVTFHLWPRAGQQPSNTRSKQQLAHGYDDVETTDERQAKRPKLTSANENIDSPNDIDDDSNSDCSDNHSSNIVGMRHSKSGFDAATAHNENFPNPSASICSNAAASSSTCPSGQCNTQQREEATKYQPHEADASWWSRTALQQTDPLPGAQYMRQAGQCKSCSTFRTSLLEALSMVQNLLAEDVSSTGGFEPMKEDSNARYSFGKRSTASKSMTKRTMNRGSYSNKDDELPSIQVNGTNLPGQTRQLSPLEERRLRAWRRENKSESWITSKLNNTKSAGGQVEADVRQSSSRRKRDGKKGRRCSTCGKAGHNTRTCQEIVETSSADSETSHGEGRD